MTVKISITTDNWNGTQVKRLWILTETVVNTLRTVRLNWLSPRHLKQNPPLRGTQASKALQLPYSPAPTTLVQVALLLTYFWTDDRQPKVELNDHLLLNYWNFLFQSINFFLPLDVARPPPLPMVNGSDFATGRPWHGFWSDWPLLLSIYLFDGLYYVIPNLKIFLVW